MKKRFHSNIHPALEIKGEPPTRHEDGEALDYLNVAFEIKNLHDDEEDANFFIFEGLASTFGNLDSLDDIIAPGAFIKSLETRTPIILWQHRTSEPIGMPIEIKETVEGLFIIGRMPRNDDLVKGRVIPQMQVGSVRSMSIGFRTIQSEFNTETNIRVIKEVELFEVSLVTFPANNQAIVTGFKSKKPGFTVEQIKEFTERDLEKALRESGFCSKDAAVYLVSKFAKLGEPVGDDVAIEGLQSISDCLNMFSLKQASKKLDNLIG